MCKRNIFIPLVLSSLIATTGCTKFLTNDDPQRISDEMWWNTETDAKNALQTVYAGIPGGTTGRNVMYLSGMSDEAVARGDFKGQYDLFTRGLHSSAWGVAENIWKDDYIDIRRANRFLENVDKCVMDEARKSRMKLEARALRAYYHMELMIYFGDIPLVTKTLSEEKGENKMSRNKLAEVYSFVVSELKECAELLPKDYTNDDQYRISSGVCNALLTRIGLYYHDFELAKESAWKIIDSKKYELHISSVKANSYGDLFNYNAELNKERIFFVENGCSSAWTTFAPFGGGGESYVSPTNTVVDNYETRQGKVLNDLGPDSLAIYQKTPKYKNNRDPRLDASILANGDSFLGGYTLSPFTNPSDKIGEPKSTATGFWIKKYLDVKDKQAKKGTLDFMIIRYAEIILSYAEALIETDDWNNPLVLKYINDVRDRAGMPAATAVVYDSKSKLTELIRRERQSELAFEGQRYFDIRRWKTVNTVMNGDVFGAYNTVVKQFVKVQTRFYDPERDSVWPIPLKETNANENLEQNPNY